MSGVTFERRPHGGREYAGDVPRGVTMTTELLRAIADAHDLVQRPLTHSEIYYLALSLLPVEALHQ